MTQHTSPRRSGQQWPSQRPVQVQGNVLTTVIRRLEAATSRLEDIASTSVGFDVTGQNGAPASASGSVSGAAPSTAAPASKAADSLPPSIQALDELTNNEFKTWLDLSSKLGSVIDGQVWQWV